MQASPNILILSVGYGQGHHSAAAALAEQWEARGCHCCIADPCELTYPRLFHLTQRFYRFCVRRAPWLWGITYAQTDTANWRKGVQRPLLSRITETVRGLAEKHRPDIIFCTYPLYAYMLDILHEQGLFHGRYAVVVTDAREISRPWMQSAAPLFFVTDAESSVLVRRQFGLSAERVRVAGFPVRKAFSPLPDLPAPSARDLRILYAAYRSVRETADAVRALLAAYPAARITLLGGENSNTYAAVLAKEVQNMQVHIMPATRQFAELLRQSHLYIGKAGAATLFECYAAQVPLLINFALPGQEQGNLELALQDGVAQYAESADAMVHAVTKLLEGGAAPWQRVRARMAASGRNDGAIHIVQETERRWLHADIVD